MIWSIFGFSYQLKDLTLVAGDLSVVRVLGCVEITDYEKIEMKNPEYIFLEDNNNFL